MNPRFWKMVAKTCGILIVKIKKKYFYLDIYDI